MCPFSKHINASLYDHAVHAFQKSTAPIIKKGRPLRGRPEKSGSGDRRKCRFRDLEPLEQLTHKYLDLHN